MKPIKLGPQGRRFGKLADIAGLNECCSESELYLTYTNISAFRAESARAANPKPYFTLSVYFYVKSTISYVSVMLRELRSDSIIRVVIFQ